MAEVSAKLMQLELNGQVQLLPGGRVQRMGR
jgi:predicted Rossmann fold nucleotide-binding protein DprA/Smf involved in DNA uptake